MLARLKASAIACGSVLALTGCGGFTDLSLRGLFANWSLVVAAAPPAHAGNLLMQTPADLMRPGDARWQLRVGCWWLK